MDQSDRTREGILARRAGAFRVGKSLSQARKCSQGATRNAGVQEIPGPRPEAPKSTQLGKYLEGPKCIPARHTPGEGFAQARYAHLLPCKYIQADNGDIVRVASFILGNVGGGKFQGSWLPQFDFSHMNCNLVREYYKQELVAKRL